MAVKKAAEIAEAIGKRQQEADDLEAVIARLADDEKIARIEHARNLPGKRMYGLGKVGLSEPLRIRSEREKSEKSLATLRLELEALAVVHAEAKHVESEAVFERKLEEAADIAKAEEAIWAKAGEPFAALVAVWSELVEHYEARDEFVEGCADLVMERPDRRQEFEAKTAHAVAPASGDLYAFLTRIYDVTCDPRGNGYRIDFRKHPSVHGRADRNFRLAPLLPDIRGTYRHPAFVRAASHEVTWSEGWGNGQQPTGDSGDALADLAVEQKRVALARHAEEYGIETQVEPDPFSDEEQAARLDQWTKQALASA